MAKLFLCEDFLWSPELMELNIYSLEIIAFDSFVQFTDSNLFLTLSLFLNYLEQLTKQIKTRIRG